jgi:hypothetical protein
MERYHYALESLHVRSLTLLQQFLSTVTVLTISSATVCKQTYVFFASAYFSFIFAD